MADWEDNEPGEHNIRLLQGLLALIVLCLLLPCGLVGFGPTLQQELATLTGLTAKTAGAILLAAPEVPAVLLSMVGCALARTHGSRLLFVATGLIGLHMPCVVLLLS